MEATERERLLIGCRLGAVDARDKVEAFSWLLAAGFVGNVSV